MTLHRPVSALTANISFLLPSAISTPSIARQNGIMLTTVWGEYILLYSPKIPPSPFLPSDEKISIEDNASGNKAATKENKADNKAGQATGVTIDTEGLPGRLLKLPLAAGYYYQLYSDGKKVWYSNSGNTKVFDLAEQKEEIVAEGANMSVAEGNKKPSSTKAATCMYVISLATKLLWTRK